MNCSISDRLSFNMKSNNRKRIAMGIAIAAQFIGAFVGGIVIGRVVDDTFSTEPMGLFGGVSIGLTVGIILLVKAESKLSNNDK